MDISSTLPTFSMAAAATKKADAGKDKKKVDTSNEPGICTRVWEAVKYVLATIWSVAATGIYYLSCKCIDVRPSTTPKLMFANQKDFHSVGSKEQKDIEAEVAKVIRAKISGQSDGLEKDAVVKTVSSEFTHKLIAAQKAGLNPEWQMCDGGITIYVAQSHDIKKLPKLDSTAAKENKDGVTVTAWKSETVKLPAADKKAKPTEVKCHALTVSFDCDQFPAVKQAKEFEELEKEVDDLEGELTRFMSANCEGADPANFTAVLGQLQETTTRLEASAQSTNQQIRSVRTKLDSLRASLTQNALKVYGDHIDTQFATTGYSDTHTLKPAAKAAFANFLQAVNLQFPEASFELVGHRQVQSDNPCQPKRGGGPDEKEHQTYMAGFWLKYEGEFTNADRMKLYEIVQSESQLPGVGGERYFQTWYYTHELSSTEKAAAIWPLGTIETVAEAHNSPFQLDIIARNALVAND